MKQDFVINFQSPKGKAFKYLNYKMFIYYALVFLQRKMSALWGRGTSFLILPGLKKFSNWPTYPQLYVNGELVGGLDIIKEAIENGEFDDMVPKKT